MTETSANVLSELLTFLRQFIIYRIQSDTGTESKLVRPTLQLPSESDSAIIKLITELNLDEKEIIALLMSLTPHVTPNFYDNILAECFPNGGSFTEFGGVKGKNHRGILPTGETISYVLSGHDMRSKLENRILFNSNNSLLKAEVFHLNEPPQGEPRLSGQVVLNPDFVELLTTGNELKPTLSPSFPAELIETGMDWEQLVLKDKTVDEVKEIEIWLKYNDTVLHEWDMKGIIKPGYRVMFYGPPGTGKTLTASLLGKYTNRDVYRIDLSMIVSKYIGETEKNLGSLFNKAKNKNWILFFDEADAIFGKRTNVRDAHDKYANQEVSYLLQKIEAHPGLVILASNIKNNIDEAFARRFQSIIQFELPSSEERVQLWKNSLPRNIKIAKDVSFEELSERYDLTGANIINVVQFACLMQLSAGSKEMKLKYLTRGIQKEYIKEGKMN